MSIMRNARDGVVRHPLSGQVEFTSTDRGLAEKVAADLDRSDPVTETYVYEALAAVPPAQRARLEWVMPLRVLNVIRRLGTYGGSSYWAARSLGEPEYLLGHPIVIDEEAEGLTIRTGVNA